MLNLTELVNSKIVRPVQERLRKQQEAVVCIETRCAELAQALELQKKYIAELEQKIADLSEKQQLCFTALAEAHARQQQMESAVSAINWEE